MQENEKRESQTLKQIFKQYLLPQKWQILFIAALILVGVALGNASPYIYGKMVDAISGGNLNGLMFLIALYCGVTLLTLGLSLFEKYCGEMVSFRIAARIRQSLFDKVVRAKCKDFSKFTSGEYIARLNGDSEGIVSFFLDLITNIGQIAVNLAISIGFIIGISLRLSSVAFFYLPASFLVSYFARKHYKKLAQHQRELEDKHYSFLTETLANHSGIKSFQMEDGIIAKYSEIISRRLRLVKRNLFLGNVISVISSVVMLASSMYIIYTSALLIKGGALTLGDMISFNTYINIMFSSVGKIWSFNISRQTVLVSAGRISDILNMESEEQDQDGMSALMNHPPFLQASNVGFCYPETDVPVLDDVSFCIEREGLYCFVGKNGCGKSTLAKLLVRFYDTNRGEFQLHGRPYHTYSLKELRKAITYIQKDDFFLNDTICQNLLIANPSAEMTDIELACREADIYDFIMSLPEQFDTVIGEGGSTLSSGQKQKLGIARALLRKSDLLILDEVTANLDGEAEQEVLSVLLKLRKHAAVLLISHRASSIMKADTIFVVDEGKIAAFGSHASLCDECTLYQQLFCEANAPHADEHVLQK